MFICTRIKKTIVREDFRSGPDEKTRVTKYDEPVTRYGKESLRGLLEWLEQSYGMPIQDGFVIQGRSTFNTVVVRRLEMENGVPATEHNKQRWREGIQTLYTAEIEYKLEKRITAPIFAEDYNGLVCEREVLSDVKKPELVKKEG